MGSARTRSSILPAAAGVKVDIPSFDKDCDFYLKAEDIQVEDTHFEIYTEVEDFGTVRDALAGEGYEFSMADLRYLPQTMTERNRKTSDTNGLWCDEYIISLKKLLELRRKFRLY